MMDQEKTKNPPASTEEIQEHASPRCHLKWDWMVVAASFFTSFLLDGLVYSSGVLFVAFQNEFQESKSHTSVIGTCLVALIFLTGKLTIFIYFIIYLFSQII